MPSRTHDHVRSGPTTAPPEPFAIRAGGGGRASFRSRRPSLGSPRERSWLPRRSGFVLRLQSVELLQSALRHDVAPDDILHALEHAVVLEEIGDDPIRWLVLGPDRATRFLELVVLDRPQGPAVIHAMPMRTKYEQLLKKRR